jgi:hypothetical protein
MRAGCLTTSFFLHPTQRTLFATQSRFSKILRLLLSIFLIIMALLRSQRVSIGALLQLLPLPHSLYPDSSITDAIDTFSPPSPLQVPEASCIFSMRNAMLLVSASSAPLERLPCWLPPSLLHSP